MVLISGDVHGEIVKRFSKRQHPELRGLDESDIIIVAGDFGCPWYNKEIKYYDYWTQPGSEQEELYKLRFLNNQPWTTIVVCGNHENYDLIEQMPQTILFGATVRQCQYEGETFDKIFYVDTLQIMTINQETYLMIPGAESHDADYIFDWDEPGLKDTIKNLNRRARKGEHVSSYRIKHFSWWPQEKIPAIPTLAMIPFLADKDYANIDASIDYVITHDCPASVHSSWKPYGAPGRLKPTKSEEVLETIRENIDYKIWIHGHLHTEFYLPFYKTYCIYTKIRPIEEILDTAKYYTYY